MSAYSINTVFKMDEWERKAKNGAKHICFQVQTD